MEHQKLRFRKAFFFRLKPFGPPLLTVSALFISFKSHMLYFKKRYVLFVLRKPFDKFYTFLESWFSDSGLHSHFSLLTVKHDWWLAEMRKMGEGKENFIKFHDVWDWFCGHWTVCLRQGWRELIVFSIDTWQCLALERKGGPQLYFS